MIGACTVHIVHSVLIEEAAYFPVIYCWAAQVQITMPIYYSTASRRKNQARFACLSLVHLQGIEEHHRGVEFTLCHSFTLAGQAGMSQDGWVENLPRAPQRSEKSKSESTVLVAIHEEPSELIYTHTYCCRHFFLTLRFNENSQKFWKIRHPKVFSKIFNNESYANSAHFWNVNIFSINFLYHITSAIVTYLLYFPNSRFRWTLKKVDFSKLGHVH